MTKKTTTLTIRISEELKEKLADLAAIDDRTLSYYAHKIIEDHIFKIERKMYLEKNKQKNKIG